MNVIYIDNRPVLKLVINGSEVTVRFSDKPQPQIMDNIIEILTSCYENRIQKLLKDVIGEESA